MSKTLRMLPGHRNKAIVGVGLWLVVLSGFIGFGVYTKNHKAETAGDALVAVLWMTLVAQMLLALWGGFHLAKGKGYSGALACLGLIPCFQPVLLTVLAVLPDRHPRHKAHSKHTHRHRSSESSIGRVIRYRRNALIGNAFGLFGILVGVSLVLIPIGYAEDPDTETIVGSFVFLLGYSGVISGCWWWAKAKGWPDGIVFIGLLPLAIMCIPWIKLIFVAAPLLLPISMVMMPIILLVIMFVLPDKSGANTRR